MRACLPEAECQVALAEVNGRVCSIQLICADKATFIVHRARHCSVDCVEILTKKHSPDFLTVTLSKRRTLGFVSQRGE